MVEGYYRESQWLIIMGSFKGDIDICRCRFIHRASGS